MANVIKYLEKFNRKERYWLLRRTLGDENNNPFTLSDEFRKKLDSKLRISIPKDAKKVFMAMDYHFDWLRMALLLGKHPDRADSPIPIEEVSEDINKNQEDIDLLIAFEDDKVHLTHLILIEAKAYTGWNKKQLKSKANRLGIFNQKKFRAYCEPHFVLMSPKQPSLDVEWPDWMKAKGKTQDGRMPYWLELTLPVKLQVERREKNAKGDYTQVVVQETR